MPFSYSIQCPSAEADRHTMHRNHPQTVPGTGPLEATPKPRRSFRQEPFFAHNRIPSGPPLHPSLAQQIKPPTRQDRSHASEPSPPTAGALIPKDSSPGQTCNRTTGPPSNHGFATTDRLRSHAPRDAPEPDSLCKEQSRPLSQPLNGVITQPRTPCLSHVIKPNSGHSAIQLVLPSEALNQWERLSSFLTKRLTPRLDRGAHAVCFANGGGGDDRDRTDDPLLAKQVLSQLSYAPKPEDSLQKPTPPEHPTGAPPNRHHRTPSIGWGNHLVGQGGFEPPTPRLSSVCSNQLSY